MVVGSTTVFIVGIAREFPPVYGHIVSPGKFRVDSEGCEGLQNHGKLRCFVKTVPGNKERKIQIPQIMEYGSAAGETADQGAALLLEKGGSAFHPGVLIFADDHGVLVLPEVEDYSIFCLGQKEFFDGQVPAGIEGVAFICVKSHGW